MSSEKETKDLAIKSKEEAVAEANATSATTASTSTTTATAKPTGMRLEDLFKLLSMPPPDVKNQPKPLDQYKFWKTQPVTKFDESVESEGPIDSKTIDDVPKEPSPLPAGFEWSTIDINQPEQVQEIYDLLYSNYIEDDDETFRFKYSPTFLNWGLKPPGWNKDWNVGVRVKDSGKLIAFISGIPGQLTLHENPDINVAEINFLCVHKKLRSKRLAPVLIREVTRRVNLTGVWQALYTAGIVLPSPITTARYYHRSINWPKLYDVGFTGLPSNSTAAKQVARFALPSKQTLDSLRPMVKDDVPEVYQLFNEYLKRFELVPKFSEDEMKHWFIGADNDEEKVVYSYVVVDDDGAITDFVSFYGLESTVLGNSNHDSINVAYLFYYATKEGINNGNDDTKLKNRLFILIQNALILAKQNNFDVFNALSVQDNALFLEDLKFGAGDGFLNYYLFNYKAYPIHGGIKKGERTLERKQGGVGVIMF